MLDSIQWRMSWVTAMRILLCAGIAMIWGLAGAQVCCGDTLLSCDFTAANGSAISDLPEWITVHDTASSTQLIYIGQGRFIMEQALSIANSVRAVPTLYPAIDPCGIHVEYTVRKITDSTNLTDGLNGSSRLCLTNAPNWSDYASSFQCPGEKLVWQVTWNKTANTADLVLRVVNAADATYDNGVVIHSVALSDLDMDSGDRIQLAMELRDGDGADVRVGYQVYNGTWLGWQYSPWFDPTDAAETLGLGDDAFGADWMVRWASSTYFYMENYSDVGHETQVWVDDALITGNPGTAINPPDFYLDISPADQVKLAHVMSDLRRAYLAITGGILPETPVVGYKPLQVTWVSGSANAADPDPLKDWDYQRDVRVDAIEITAVSEVGVTNAIYDLLHRWGCRWVFPGTLGESFPAPGTVLTLPSGLDRVHQSTAPDAMAYCGYDNDTEYSLWLKRNGLSAERYFPHSHTWMAVVNPAIYFDPVNHPESYHPEYYALIGGVRTPTQPCTTNPEVINLFIQSGLTTLGVSSLASVSIEPDDNIAFCQCENCRALDPPGVRPDGQKSMTNRVVTLANAVADAVAGPYPTKKVSILAYSTHLDPPVGVSPRQNVSVSVCRNACWVHLRHDSACPSCQQWWDLLDDWLVIANEVRLYEYLPICWTGNLPSPLYLEHGASLAEQVNRGVVGSISDSGNYQGMASNFPVYYMDFRMKVDADQDPDVILADMCGALFGPAAGVMETYYRTLAQVTDKQFPERQPGGINGTAWGYEMLFDPCMIASARASMDQALALTASDATARARVEYVQLGFNYLEDYLDGMWSAQNGDYQGFLDAFDAVDDDIDALAADDPIFNAADARSRMKTARLKSQAKYFPNSMAFVRSWTVLGPFDNSTLDAHITPDLFPASMFPSGVTPGQPVELADGSMTHWTNYASSEGLIDFDVPLDSSDQIFSWGYAAVTVHVPTAQTVRILYSTFYAYRLFVNGVEVASRMGLDADCPDKASVTVSLPAGDSTLIFKSSQTAQESYTYRWGFYLRILDVGWTISPDITTWQFQVPEPATCQEVQDWGYALTGDISGDCYVDMVDLQMMADAWVTDDAPADLDGDNRVDLADFAVLAGDWMQCNHPSDMSCD